MSDLTRKNRETGTKVTITEREGEFVTLCEAHQKSATHKSRSARDLAARKPSAWCTGCARVVKVGPSKP